MTVENREDRAGPGRGRPRPSDHPDDPTRALHLLARAATQAGPSFHAAEVGVVAILDVRHLGRINVRHGVTAGDRVLAAMERSLRRQVTGRDCVVRLPGDQFMVIGPGRHDEEDTAARLGHASKVWVRVRGGRFVRASAAVGVATWSGTRSPRTALEVAASRLPVSHPRARR